MSYEAVMEQVKLVPEQYLGELSVMIQSLLCRHEGDLQQSVGSGLEEYFGALDLGDGLAVQREMRDEWN